MASNSSDMMNELQSKMNDEFELKDLGEIKHFLGIEVLKDDKGNFMISQERYIKEVVKNSGIDDAKESKYPLDLGYDKVVCGEKLGENDEYQKLIGILLYIATNTRPDISASVAILSQKNKNPSRTDLNEVKRVIRYLKGTKGLKLKISSVENQSEKLHSYCDANWVENRKDRKSNSGYICLLNGGTISLVYRKQECVSLSLTEAEYVACAEAVQEMVWIKSICEDFGIKDDQPMNIYEDNQSCIKMAENQRFSKRTKHIDTKFFILLRIVRIRQLISEKKKNYQKLKEIRTEIHDKVLL